MTQNTGILYGIKLVRLVLMYSAISIGIRLSEAEYVEKVYGKGEKPPSLISIVLTIGAFIAVFDALLIAMMRSTGDIGSKGGLLGAINFRRYVMFESMIYTVFVLSVGYWVLTLAARKKYFNYKMDGMRALRASKEILMAMVVPFSVTPVFFAT